VGKKKHHSEKLGINQSGKSKMAATSTVAYNKVDPKSQTYGIVHQNPHFFASGNAVVTSKVPLDEWFTR